MKPSRMALLLAAIAGGLAPVGVSGQSNRPTHWFDVSVGAGRPLNGRYQYSAGPAIDANVVFQVGRSRAMVMAAAAAQGGFIGNDKCISDGHGGCLENLPSIRSSGVLLGVDLFGPGQSRWSATISAGPGVSSVNGEDYGEHVTVVSWHGRLDFASSITRRSAVVASARASVFPSEPLDVRGTAAGGLGLRIRF